VHGAGRAPGTAALLVPGELEAGFEREYRRDGIPLSAATVDGILAASASVGAARNLLG
jgi:LDH2 family malate/lactate/ureidoglycolate dehydrogenase